MANTSTPASKKMSLSRASILLMIGIVFVAITLRSPLTSVGPIIGFIREGVGISNVWAGFLTTIPLLAFAFVSPFAPKVARRLGMEKTLFLSTSLLLVGIVVRSLGNAPLLFIGTALIGIAIAFGNVLLPSLIKLRFPLQVGLLTGIFTVSMNLSAGLAAGFSYPIAANTKYGWQGALGCWVVLCIIALILWLPQMKQNQPTQSQQTSHGARAHKSLWRIPLVWSVTLSMGLQSLIFYTTAAWIPEMLQSQGLNADEAGWMLSVMQFSQLPMTFLIPILAGRLKNQRMLVVLFTILYASGFCGILFGHASATIIWMILLGLAGGTSFGLIMMFFTLRTTTAYEAAELSGFAQSIGYLLAAVGPVLFGYVHDLTNTWTMPLVLFLVTTGVLFVTAWHAGQNKFVYPEK